MMANTTMKANTLMMANTTMKANTLMMANTTMKANTSMTASTKMMVNGTGDHLSYRKYRHGIIFPDTMSANLIQ